MSLFQENTDFVDEEHIHAFAKALVWEELEDEADVPASLDCVSPSPKKHHLITSKSDWYPVQGAKRAQKRPKSAPQRPLSNEFRLLATYTLLRIPLLVVITLWILFLCSQYTLVRAYVAFLEYCFTWVGERRRLRDRLRAATTYEEWVERATALDEFLNLDKWLQNPRFSYYDLATVRLTMRRLKAARTAGDHGQLALILQGCVRKNFAGIENRQLYLHRYYGTKDLVGAYIEEVTISLDTVATLETLSFATRRRFFRTVLKNYGKLALCLSGGACFAYTHFGVVKALLDNGLLPSIISGTSGGGLVALLACTRTDEELKKLLVPELAQKITACEEPWWVWVPRFWRTGARFDSIDWARKLAFFTGGSTTFSDAYKRTGRILNISTIPADPHSPVILCNNVTLPHCVIWLSLLASSAVPGILNPVVLMMKNPETGVVEPFSFGNKWRDGSLRTDIPVDALNTYYNVTFSVVSQVNPHISLFFFAAKGTVGRPVAVPRRKTHRGRFASLRGGFVATALEHLYKLEIKKWLQMVKTLDLLPNFLEQDWLNIWLQNFLGSVTVWPRNRLADFLYILLDPTQEQLRQLILKGERCMYPRLLFIKHRQAIERAVDRGRKLTRLSTNVTDLLSTPTSTPQPEGPFSVGTVHYDSDTDSGDDEYEGPSPFDRRYGNDDEEEDDDDYVPSSGEEQSDSVTSGSVDENRTSNESEGGENGSLTEDDDNDTVRRVSGLIPGFLRRNSSAKIRRNTVI